MNIPTFGRQKEGANYQKRIGAYIIISNVTQTELLLVQAPNGAYFLPGGEIEKGETQEQAIHREVMEELGFTVEIGHYLGQADEYFHSNHRQTDYHNPGYFYVAKSWKKKSAPLETFNQLRWFPIEKGQAELKRGSHKWAIEEWQTSIKNKVEPDQENGA